MDLINNNINQIYMEQIIFFIIIGNFFQKNYHLIPIG